MRTAQSNRPFINIKTLNQIRVRSRTAPITRKASETMFNSWPNPKRSPHSRRAGVHADRDAYIADTQNFYGEEQPFSLKRWPKAPATSLSDLPPSRLLDVRFEIVPFTGRRKDLERLEQWRDASLVRAVRVVYAPGGYGKTRLAAKFVTESQKKKWTTVQAFEGQSVMMGEERFDISSVTLEAGLLLVVDYAERWAPEDLRLLCAYDKWPSEYPLRFLFLARPNSWLQGLEHELTDNLSFEVDYQELDAVPTVTDEREQMFITARDRFAVASGIEDPNAIRIPSGLTGSSFAGILNIHMAALVAVDAFSTHRKRPVNHPEALSQYLLRRERNHWSRMYDARRIDSTPTVMRRVTFVAALTGEVPVQKATQVLEAAGLAHDPPQAQALLDDHEMCYPSATEDCVLAPLYPDRLAEDFVALTLPGYRLTSGDRWTQPVPQKIIDLFGNTIRTGGELRAVTLLREAALRWPHLERYLPAPEKPSVITSTRVTDSWAAGNVDSSTALMTLTQAFAILGYRELQSSLATLWTVDNGNVDVEWARTRLRGISKAAEFQVESIQAGRPVGMTGYHRFAVLAAIHAIVVAIPLFEALDDLIHRGTPRAKTMAAAALTRVTRHLSDLPLPSLSPNQLARTVNSFYEKSIGSLKDDLARDLPGLGSDELSGQPLSDDILVRAQDHYRDLFLHLAVNIPEFSSKCSYGMLLRVVCRRRRFRAAWRGLSAYSSTDPLGLAGRLTTPANC